MLLVGCGALSALGRPVASPLFSKTYAPPVIVHLNGSLIPSAHASISPLDRGFLLGDGLYEGLRAFDGRVVSLARHAERLRAGLALAGIPWDVAELGPICHTLIEANHAPDCFIYLQVTRGAPAPGQPPRARVLSGKVTPTVFAYAVPAPALSAYPPVPSKSARTVVDQRWLLGHVKSISLMGGVIGAMEAHAHGADDAVLIRSRPDGDFAAEGTSANLIAVFESPHGSDIVTPPLGHCPILAGVTRDLLLEACAGSSLRIVERPIPAESLPRATELLLCGTLTMVTSITSLNGTPVGSGKPGPIALALLHALCDRIRAEKRAIS
ncbi:MAG: hypothetical protein DYG92_05795 [Leptolyngbya sp. PLA1]|nr:hypothetical protein [Leptolyngbya sp. PLA1]